jgi:hypothetical protein
MLRSGLVTEALSSTFSTHIYLLPLTYCVLGCSLDYRGSVQYILVTQISPSPDLLCSGI